MTGKKELVVYSSPASAVPDDESHVSTKIEEVIIINN